MSVGSPAPPRVGVLALQGGVAEHARMLEALGAEVVLVRRESDLVGSDGPRLDAMVLPGGESSTQDRLLRLLDLREPLRAVIAGGIPVLGTCAGLILLARDVRDPAPEQSSLGVLDISVRRNAFGSQLVSAEAEFIVTANDIEGSGHNRAVRGALIRAPEIVAIGPDARSITTYQGRTLGATSVSGPKPETPPGEALGEAAGDALGDAPGEAAGDAPGEALGRITGISFHPELSGDPAFHRALIAQASNLTRATLVRL